MSHLCQLVNPLYEDKSEKPLTSVSLLTKILCLTPTRESFAKWLGNGKNSWDCCALETMISLRRQKEQRSLLFAAPYCSYTYCVLKLLSFLKMSRMVLTAMMMMNTCSSKWALQRRDDGVGFHDFRLMFTNHCFSLAASWSPPRKLYNFL